MSKNHRFGKKQRHGSSRSSYFSVRKLWLAAKNKARRIAKDAARCAKQFRCKVCKNKAGKHHALYCSVSAGGKVEAPM
jgi:hypothetical protein